MRLLIDATVPGSPGLLQLRDELTHAVVANASDANEVVFLAPSGAPIPNQSGLEVATTDEPFGGWIDRWRWSRRGLPRLIRQLRADVVYELGGIVSSAVIASAGTVTTVNNMIPFTPSVDRLYPLLSRMRLRHAILRRTFISSLRMADAVVLHSHHALAQLSSYTGDISQKAFVALTGVPRDVALDPVSRPAHPYGDVPYFLCFSTLRRYHSHVNLIEAYRLALQEAELPDLLIAGLARDEAHLDNVQTAIRRANVGRKVRYVGALDRHEVPAWIHHATAYIFPSLCETNPVVLSEALGLGSVVACSGIPPMSEVVGDAAELFDPESVDSIRSVLLRLHRNPERREELRRLALRRAKELSWDECGQVIWQAAERADAAFKTRQGVKRHVSDG